MHKNCGVEATNMVAATCMNKNCGVEATNMVAATCMNKNCGVEATNMVAATCTRTVVLRPLTWWLPHAQELWC